MVEPHITIISILTISIILMYLFTRSQVREFLSALKESIRGGEYEDPSAFVTVTVKDSVGGHVLREKTFSIKGKDLDESINGLHIVMQMSDGKIFKETQHKK